MYKFTHSKILTHRECVFLRFRFPASIDLREKWAHFCGIPVDNVTLHTYLCWEHFVDDDFIVRRWMKEQPRKELK